MNSKEFGPDASDSDDIWGRPEKVYYIPFFETLAILRSVVSTKDTTLYEFDLPDSVLTLLHNSEAIQGTTFVGYL